ncbi:MAG: methyltransferase domain-containing protein [Polyangiaceae bacterium]|nr:methyltransferase domain-containing protein [Polyangiaceae bacterium]
MTALRYDCDRARLSPGLAARFVELEPDDETRAFVQAAADGRHGRLLSWVHSTLGAFLSDFDVNGLLGTYPLFLLSQAQWSALLGPERRARLLDVGAGAGEVTARIAGLAQQVVTSETSRMMARRLRQRGFECRRTDFADGPPADRFDLVTCLNVVDRSDRPRTLLRNLRAGLAPGGRLVIATPLPFRPFVYAGGTTREPRERLPIDAEPWESALAQLVERVLCPLGLEVIALCRAPYLSGGDPGRELYVLDDAVVVCGRSEPA